jgi:putative transposase
LDAPRTELASEPRYGSRSEGATENAAAVQALLDNLVERGLDPKVPRLFILDGAKALSKAVRATFGRHTPIHRYQVHKAGNIAARCPKKHVTSVRWTLRKAWEPDDAAETERVIRDLAKRMQRDAPGVAASLLEGLDEILTVNRLRLPRELVARLHQCHREHAGHDPARDAQREGMARCLDGAAPGCAGMMEAQAGFRWLKAYRHLPALRHALAEHNARHPHSTG